MILLEISRMLRPTLLIELINRMIDGLSTCFSVQVTLRMRSRPEVMKLLS